MKFPLAIMDYGIGGMGLVARIKEHYPHFPILYFSDSGEVPYGKLKAHVLKNRVNKVIDFLYRQGAGHVVVACHSASSVVASNDQLTSIREITVSAIPVDHNKSIGIIGGGRTIRARYYQKVLKHVNKDVQQRIAQPLSILIERGEVDSEELQKTLRMILNPIRNVDKLLLACTHYPAISKSISSVMKDECELIDPIAVIYKELSTYLKQFGAANGEDQYFTSGDPALMSRAAKLAFDVRVEQVSKVRIH